MSIQTDRINKEAADLLIANRRECVSEAITDMNMSESEIADMIHALDGGDDLPDDDYEDFIWANDLMNADIKEVSDYIDDVVKRLK